MREGWWLMENLAGVDEALREVAWDYVEEVWEDLIEDIRSLVAIESVEDLSSAAPGAPFGAGPARALKCALEIAERLGLEPHNLEGYIGYGELKGEKEDYLATIAHADIVPLGEGWTHDPLDVVRREGYILGRGTIDDKGPLVLSLWAAHFFVRQCARTGKALPYTLRCLIGSNEETGMADVDYYLAHNPEPLFCFSPDAMFPLICGEKGHWGTRIVSRVYPMEETLLVSFTGGTAPNAIPGRAEAVVAVAAEDLPARDHITVSDAGIDALGRKASRISAVGRGGHASEPAGTLNAIALICDYLKEAGIDLGAAEDFVRFQRLLLADSYGRALGVATTDDVFDKLTCVGGVVRTEEVDGGIRLSQSIDIRYPTTTSGEQLMARISGVASGLGLVCEGEDDARPFYIEPTSPEIQALLSSYHEVFGRDDDAVTIGGGTYARHFGHAVAFGPLDGQVKDPAWVGPEHGPDEGVAEISLKRALVTYILSIARLMELDL